MKTYACLAAVLCLGASGVAVAQDASKQAHDEAECGRIAIQQTGFDPARPPPPQATPNMQVAGSGARMRGAAAGAVIGGASGGDAGKGAAAGAVAGGVAQRSRNRRATRAQNPANAQVQQGGMAAYTQAKSACMAGRGYHIK